MALTRRARRFVATTTVLAALTGLGAVAIRLAADRLVLAESCTARAAGTTVRVSLEQAEQAATIAAVATRRDLPARALTIALATALQESGLRNLDHGDRDSLGVFQQRPSQGWGTAEQVQNPGYAAGVFYDALVKLDYRRMDIGAAAQQVQRSGFPDAYDKHESRARVLASALAGHSPAAFSCAFRTSGRSVAQPEADGRTSRAGHALREVQAAFGAGAVVVTPANPQTPRTVQVRMAAERVGSRRFGWSTAQWLVAHARRLELARVSFEGQGWTAARSVRGWQSEDQQSLLDGEQSTRSGYLFFEVR